jgi:hypothetical protein
MADTAFELRKQAAQLLDEAARLDAQPKDDFSVGAVITWEKQFPGSLRWYQYIALKTPRGWYVTGANTSRQSWDDIVRMIGDAQVWFVSEWTEA